MRAFTYIAARDLPDAWFQALYALIENGYVYTIDQGSYAGSKRYEFPFVCIQIDYPLSEPYLPDFPPALGLPPVADSEYVLQYFNEYLLNPEVADNEQYTYGSRICEDIGGGVHQLDLLLERLQDHPNSNQLVLQIAKPSDITLDSPPCLRSLQYKVIDGELNFHIYFRSNDLWNGFPVNMAAIAMLMKYSCADAKLKPGKFIYFSGGLHIYDHCFDLAKVRLYRENLVPPSESQISC